MKDKTSSSDIKEGNKEVAINQSIWKPDYGDLLWVRLHGSSWWPAQVVDESTVSAIHQPRKRREGEILVRLYGSYKYSFINPISSLLEFKDTLEKYSGSYNAILEESLKQDLHQLKCVSSKKKEIKTKGKFGADVSMETILKKKQNAIGKAGTKKVTSSASKKGKQDTKHRKPKVNGAVSPGTSSGKTSADATPKTSVKRASSSSHNSEQGNSKKRKSSGSHKNGSANQGHSPPGKMRSPRTKVQTPNTVQRKLRKSSTPLEETAKEPSARKVKVMQFLGLASPTGSPFIPNGSTSNSA